jgi:hypothetical protein
MRGRCGRGASGTHAAPGPAGRGLARRQVRAGDALFLRLRDAAVAFDLRLRAGIPEGEVSQLEALLTRLRGNVSGG